MIEHSIRGEENSVGIYGEPNAAQALIASILHQHTAPFDLVTDFSTAIQTGQDHSGKAYVDLMAKFTEDVYRNAGALPPNLHRRILNARWSCSSDGNNQVSVICSWISTGTFYASPVSSEIIRRLHEPVVIALKRSVNSAPLGVPLRLDTLHECEILAPLCSTSPVPNFLSYEISIAIEPVRFVETFINASVKSGEEPVDRLQAFVWTLESPKADDTIISTPLCQSTSANSSGEIALMLSGAVQQPGLGASIKVNYRSHTGQTVAHLTVDYSQCGSKFRSDVAVFSQMTLHRLLASCVPGCRKLTGIARFNLFWDVDGYDLLRVLTDYLWLRLNSQQWIMGQCFNEVNITRTSGAQNESIAWAAFRCSLDPASSAHFSVVGEFTVFGTTDKLAQDDFHEMSAFVQDVFDWLRNRLIQNERKVYRGTLQWWFNIAQVSAPSSHPPSGNQKSMIPGTRAPAFWQRPSIESPVKTVSHWPTPQDYNEAVQNPAIVFLDSELKTGRPEFAHLGLPRVRTGMFASVYKLRCDSRSWAVRLFHIPVKDQEHRYKQLSKFILGDSLSYTVGFEYIANGIIVDGNEYPLLKMEWVNGEPLHMFIAANVTDTSSLQSLRERFRTMIRELLESGVAHTDLQHGNILVSRPGELFLVDYDNMYVPALSGEKSNELGHPNYQHPRRSGIHFMPELDNFSAWVIDISLECLVEDSSLWTQVEAGDDCLLFRRTDFLDPLASPTLSMMASHPSKIVRQGAARLVEFLNADITSIPTLTG